MRVGIKGGRKNLIRGLLDAEGIEGIALLIKKHPTDPDKFDFGIDVFRDNVDVSPVGVPVFVERGANRAGNYTLDCVDGNLTMIKEA